MLAHTFRLPQNEKHHGDNKLCFDFRDSTRAEISASRRRCSCAIHLGTSGDGVDTSYRRLCNLWRWANRPDSLGISKHAKDVFTFNAQAINLKRNSGGADTKRFLHCQLVASHASPSSTATLSPLCTNKLRKAKRETQKPQIRTDLSFLLSFQYFCVHRKWSIALKVMEIYLSLLVEVSLLSWSVCGVQFDDGGANLGQTKWVSEFFSSTLSAETFAQFATFAFTHTRQSDAVGFFPPDDRFAEISGVKYVDPQPYTDDTLSGNRKQLNYNGNLVRQPPPGVHQYYQTSPYRPVQTINSLTPVNVNVVRKRPSKFPYQFANPPPSYHNSYPTDLSNPFYQNYANQYQNYPSATSPSSYPDYFNPTRYPSPASANLNGQQQLLHQPSHQYPNYYTNNYANQFGYQRPSPNYGNGGAGGLNGISNFFNNIRDSSNGPLGQISQVGGQFGKALEDISAHDDLQCVPKILCQMVRSQRRPSQLPSFMNVPGLTA